MKLHEIIERALEEDIQEGDHTSLSTIPKSLQGKAVIIAKEQGLLAGIRIAEEILYQVDQNLVVVLLAEDGEVVEPGDRLMEISGDVQAMLKAERLVLNTMQRMSGIASLTNRYVKKIEDYASKVLDTRKTTPGFRYFEKLAVKIGGGVNHRMGLYDMIMIKDNHIDFAGGIQVALERADQYRKQKGIDIQIEIETRNIEEVKEVLRVGIADRIMLDNFTPEKMKEALQVVNKQVITEASGGITLDTIEDYAQTGVDYISVGALTHSAVIIDMSMKIS